MRKIFAALAAALLVTAGNAVSIRQLQPRDNLPPAPQDAPRPAYDSRQGVDDKRPPAEEGKKPAPRPPRRDDAPPRDGEEPSREEEFEFTTFTEKGSRLAQKDPREHQF